MTRGRKAGAQIDNARLSIADETEPGRAIGELAKPGFEEHLRDAAAVSACREVDFRDAAVKRRAHAHATDKVRITNISSQKKFD